MMNPDNRTESIFNIIDNGKKRFSLLNAEYEKASIETANLENDIECMETESEQSEKILNGLLKKISLVRPIARFCLIISFSFIPFVILSYFTVGVSELKLDILFRYKYFFYSIFVVGIIFFVYDQIFSNRMKKIAEHCLHLRRQIIFIERDCKAQKSALAGLGLELEQVKNHIASLKKADVFFRHYNVYEIGNEVNTLILQNQQSFTNVVFQNLKKLESSIHLHRVMYNDSFSSFYGQISQTRSEEEVNIIINALINSENELRKLYTDTVKMLNHFSDKNMSEFYKIYYHFEELELFTVSDEKTVVISLNTPDKNIRTAT